MFLQQKGPDHSENGDYYEIEHWDIGCQQFNQWLYRKLFVSENVANPRKLPKIWKSAKSAEGIEQIGQALF